jgi:predicted RNase H-like HicB family nuclease
MEESKIALAVHLEIGVRRDDNDYIAWCIPLDVYSQGKSKNQAIASLKEAVGLWFESCLQRGVLDEALREAGFIKGTPPAGVDASVVRLDGRRAQLTSSRGFVREYIEVSIPAYIASRITEASAPC